MSINSAEIPVPYPKPLPQAAPQVQRSDATPLMAEPGIVNIDFDFDTEASGDNDPGKSVPKWTRVV